MSISREHEWSKHGTCAKPVQQTDSQFNYFKKSLELGNTYNVYK